MLAGDCVYAPRGSVHAFKNNTDQPTRIFINAAPSGFERFFAEAAQWWATQERDMSRLATIAAKYAIFPAEQSVSPLGNSLLARADQGPTLYAFGETLVILLDGKQTGEKFTTVLSVSPPGGGAGAALPRQRRRMVLYRRGPR
jgi:hypothetical protein